MASIHEPERAPPEAHVHDFLLVNLEGNRCTPFRFQFNMAGWRLGCTVVVRRKEPPVIGGSKLAEREGFEPPYRSPDNLISSYVFLLPTDSD